MMRRCEFVHNLPCEQVSARIIELEEENKKLRELVSGLNWCAENVGEPRVECEHCPLGPVEGKPLELTCENMMRELGMLGIEVM